MGVCRCIFQEGLILKKNGFVGPGYHKAIAFLADCRKAGERNTVIHFKIEKVLKWIGGILGKPANTGKL